VIATAIAMVWKTGERGAQARQTRHWAVEVSAGASGAVSGRSGAGRHACAAGSRCGSTALWPIGRHRVAEGAADAVTPSVEGVESRSVAPGQRPAAVTESRSTKVSVRASRYALPATPAQTGRVAARVID
jgi:hypothetical protein